MSFHLGRFTVLDCNVQASTRDLRMGMILCKSRGSWQAGVSLWCVDTNMRCACTADLAQFFVACEPALSGYSVGSDYYIRSRSD